ncbi:hypothetical protein JQC67_12440 [Aurantibacter crassamenti]|uniref:hypothetical protein n=1 Tax=Aurantibacter crassamenti TaxID=1837375 RepID=UPI00193A0783|nr:hypothetical protein [Aurantibacter crassamenti]MBM1106951.1 hypothetical protein [Aurantibacter crassamenti]
MKELKEVYKVEAFSDIDTEDLGNKVGVRMLKNCDYAIGIFSNQEKEEQEKIVKQANLTCDDLKSGDFYYLTNKTNIVPDTTHVTISKNMFLERMDNGRTYSLLVINWQDDCNFELEFKESNDPLKKELSTAGDKYKYEILANREKSIVLKVFWGEHEFQVEFFKGK